MLWSTAGLLVRAASLDVWTIVLWRSVFAAITLGLVFAAEHRGRIRSAIPPLGKAGISTIVLTVGTTVSYVVALRLTTVANVMIVYAALPFIATGLGFLFLGERVTRRFVMAGSIALAGIAVTAGAGASIKDVWGIVAALAMTTGFAAQLVNTKRRDPGDMTFLLAVSALICIPTVAPLAWFGLPDAWQLVACALYGTLTTGLAYVLAMRGSRLISSGEAGLVSMLDVALGPLWVWLFYDEIPSMAALVGGATVLASVLWYVMTSRMPTAPRLSTMP